MAQQIRQGAIFWFDCRPLHGDFTKRRPVVVVSPTDSIELLPEVVVVACTSTAFPSDKTAIELPSRERTPQTRTGLVRRTWAIPDWILLVERDSLTEYIGYLSGATLRKVVDAVEQRRKQAE